MTGEIIISNAFFGFWFVLGKYFLGVWAFSIFITIALGLYNLVCRR